MDINCTERCEHQNEGKCKLETVPSFVQSGTSESDCPYFSGGNPAAVLM